MRSALRELTDREHVHETGELPPATLPLLSKSGIALKWQADRAYGYTAGWGIVKVVG